MPLLPAPSVIAPLTSLVLLASQVLGGTQASFDTNTILGGNLPISPYHHLMLKAYLRGDNANAAVAQQIQFNGDAGSNYSNEFLIGTGAAASAGEAIAQTSARIGRCPGSTAPANSFGSLVAEIPNYISTVGSKGVTAQSASRENTTGSNMINEVEAAVWFGTPAAITRVLLFPALGNYVAGSAFYLYGLA